MANLIGQRIGHYEILAVLGEGGMATVYRARQLNMQREIALKIIQPDPKRSTEAATRFEREARLIASFSHIHILKVFDYGQFYGHHLRLIDESIDPRAVLFYLAMELLSGGNLADRIAKGPMSLETMASILEQVASALDYAHARNVVHRDLKPKNIMFDQDGNAILTDFGIAKIIGDELALTQTGMSMGTPLYMAPEQWQGKPVDARTDTYALGIILYEMLTGSVPFKADTPFAMAALHVNDAPPSVRASRPDLPEGIEEIINRALAKHPDARYHSASQLVNDFKAAIPERTAPAPDMDRRTIMYQADGTPHPLAASQPILIEPPRTRRPGGLLVGGIAAALVLVALVGFLLSRVGSSSTPTPSASPQSTLPVVSGDSTPGGSQATAPGTAAVVAAVSASPTLITSPMSTATLTPTAPPSATATTPPTSTATATEMPSATATATASPTFIPTATPTRTLTPTQTNTPPPTVFGGGKGKIAFFSNRDGNSEIYSMDADGKNERRLTNHLAADEWPGWSPDGRYITFSSNRDGNGEIYVMDADGTDIRRLTNNPAYDWFPVWSPDGAQIAFVSDRDGNNEVYIMDAEGLNQRRLTGSASFDAFPSWSPDSKQIVFASNRDGNYKLYAVNVNASNLRRLTNTSADDTTPSWSPDGQQIAFVSERDGNREIYVMNANGLNQRRLTNQNTADLAPSWTSDNKQIVFVSERDGNRELYIMGPDGSNTRRLTSNPRVDFGPAWQP